MTGVPIDTTGLTEIDELNETQIDATPKTIEITTTTQEVQITTEDSEMTTATDGVAPPRNQIIHVTTTWMVTAHLATGVPLHTTPLKTNDEKAQAKSS